MFMSFSIVSGGRDELLVRAIAEKEHPSGLWFVG
jgi:hypothetical protein